MKKEEFNYMLESCKDALDNYKEDLLNLLNKYNCSLDITFRFRPGEVLTMNINSDHLVRRNDIVETIIRNIKKEGIKNE